VLSWANDEKGGMSSARTLVRTFVERRTSLARFTVPLVLKSKIETFAVVCQSGKVTHPVLQNQADCCRALIGWRLKAASTPAQTCTCLLPTTATLTTLYSYEHFHHEYTLLLPPAMSLKSWLPNRARPNEYELPYYNPPMTTPPPILPPKPTASMYESVTQPRRRAEAASDELLLLQRKEEQLQDILQELLNAQSEGLMAGMGADDGASTSSLSQTTQSMHSFNISTPPSKPLGKLSLGKARREIWRTILECAAVKEEEDALLQAEQRDHLAMLDNLKNWEHKSAGLRKEIESIEQEDTGARTRALKEQADQLQQEITDTEQRLSRMRNQHRQLLEEISDLDNSVQSKLSTYKSSLAMLERDVQTFLKNPPIRSGLHSRRDSTFLSLPSNRRTIEMAKDYWDGEYKATKKQRRMVRRGQTALEEGAVVWKDVITEINGFEKFLKQASNGIEQSGNGKGKGPATEPADILARMDETIGSIEEKLKDVESKNWKLLVVCIGAELEAFRQGRDMLEDAFSEAQSNNQEIEDWANNSGHGNSGFQQDEDNEPGNHVVSGPHADELRQALYDSDEDPSPDLMVSHQRDDSE
jgi:hypothetical protein